MSSLIGRVWVWPIALCALAAASIFAARYPKASMAAAPASTAPHPQQNTDLGEKRVVYELTTPGADRGTVSYLDAGANNVSTQVNLPWTLELVAQNGSAPASIAAQASGNQLRCRILVDGVERAKDEAAFPNAAVSCNVMAV